MAWFWDLIDRHFNPKEEMGRLKIILVAGIIFLLGGIFRKALSWLVVILIIIVVYRYFRKRKEDKNGQGTVQQRPNI